MALATDAKQDEALPGGVWTTLKSAALQWLDHKDAKAGAAIAYYSIFSIGPSLLWRSRLRASSLDARACRRR
jgi:uncharacterized BrkB/YihY/UPF0761 family membrane protein